MSTMDLTSIEGVDAVEFLKMLRRIALATEGRGVRFQIPLSNLGVRIGFAEESDTSLYYCTYCEQTLPGFAITDCVDECKVVQAVETGDES